MSEANKPLDVFWFIPVSGDGAYLGSDKGYFLDDSDSVGQRRMTAIHHRGRRGALDIAANLCAGTGQMRRGAATAPVGDPKTAAARLGECRALGIETASLLFPELGIGEANRFNHGAAPGEFGVGAFEPAIAAE